MNDIKTTGNVSIETEITKKNYNIPLIVPKDIMIQSVTFSLTELCNRPSDWLTNLYSYRANFVMLYDRYPDFLDTSPLLQKPVICIPTQYQTFLIFEPKLIR